MSEESWSEFEVRPRDPHWLTAENWREISKTYEKAECCSDRARWLCELPRARVGPGTKYVVLQPARMRLCSWHKDILRSGDPAVTAIRIGPHD